MGAMIALSMAALLFLGAGLFLLCFGLIAWLATRRKGWKFGGKIAAVTGGVMLLLPIIGVAVAAIQGEEENRREEQDKGPMIRAIEAGDTKAVAELLREGEPPDGRPGPGAYAKTPLCQAAWQRSLDIVELLHTKGADVNQRSTGRRGPTPLQCVMMDGSRLNRAPTSSRAQTATLLLEHGADLNDGAPLVDAVCTADVGLVRLLLDRGADPNLGGDNPGPAIFEVTFTQNEELSSRNRAIGELLLDRGADINALDQGGRTAMDRQTWNSKSALGAWLRAHGAKMSDELRAAEAIER